MKKLIKNRKKGVAIEISIIALVVVFAISTLLVSISIMANAIGKNALSDQQEKTQLAQDVMRDIKNNQQNADNTIIKVGNTFTLTVTVKDGKIASWVYTTN